MPGEAFGRERSYDAGVELEEVLDGGNASGQVVRVGSTVRKPWLSSTPRVLAYLDALREAGIDVPRTHGRDEKGRLILGFIPGSVAIDEAPSSNTVVRRVGALVRASHDASARLSVPDDWPAGLLPAPQADLLCHNDLAPWNLVIDGDRLVFTDWDGAGPSSRSWTSPTRQSPSHTCFPKRMWSSARGDSPISSGVRRW